MLALLCDVQMKLITPSLVSERLRINVSLARAAIKDLVNRTPALVREVAYSSKQGIYTRVTKEQ
jgi:small subunit ribosomal protein S25e